MSIEPASEPELLARARAIAGATVGEIAARLGVGPRASGHKGYVGALVERALGLRARGAGPDLPALGVELKTTPIDPSGRPRESTFVCMVPRDGLEQPWEASAPRAKLARVLFVPVEAVGELDRRRIGNAFYWSPSPADDAVLASDWQELAGALRAHGHEHFSARRGTLLQVRPKAASARSRWLATGEGEAPMLALPRAFYLRRTFVATILAGSGLRAEASRGT
ncbi:MAG: MutH/Sau3AI family endonuclease [Sandaracinus sp.]